MHLPHLSAASAWPPQSPRGTCARARTCAGRRWGREGEARGGAGLVLPAGCWLAGVCVGSTRWIKHSGSYPAALQGVQCVPANQASSSSSLRPNFCEPSVNAPANLQVHLPRAHHGKGRAVAGAGVLQGVPREGRGHAGLAQRGAHAVAELLQAERKRIVARGGWRPWWQVSQRGAHAVAELLQGW